MAFHNIKRPHPYEEWKTVDEERGLLLRLKDPEDAMNSQGYTEYVFEMGDQAIGFRAYLDTHFTKSDAGKNIPIYSWRLETAMWVPLHCPYTEEQIKAFVTEAFREHGFLFDNRNNEFGHIEFITKELGLPKGVHPWH